MSGELQRRTVVITSPHGLHMRPIQAFVALASRCQSEVAVCKGDHRANGKSVLHLIGLEALPGTELTLEVSGPDAGNVIDGLAEALARVFPDDE
ncbi:MAG: HPr family phosphocarrier protein [Gemmataceae bacterium]|nr:HPr family phosphocarrier protein [Gemmataceae bacterium]